MIGSYFLFRYFAQSNQTFLADTLLVQSTNPGWGDLATKGYKCWGGEDWSCTRDDLHATWTGVAGSFQQDILGVQLDTTSPGFKQFIIAPSVPSNCKSASGQVLSVYGAIASNWTMNNNAMTLHVTIPVNTSAQVYYPSADTSKIYEGATKAAAAAGVAFQRIENNSSVFLVQSGDYTFSNVQTSGVRPASVKFANSQLCVRTGGRGSAWMVCTPFSEPARIVVYNLAGRVVASGWTKKAGEWTVIGGPAHHVTSGFYNVRAESGGVVLNRRVMMVF